MKITRLTIALCVVLLVTFAALAGQAPQRGAKSATPAAQQHVLMPPAQMKWGPPPPGLPEGAQLAVLSGDPSKAGEPYTLSAKMPDKYTIPPHWHPTTENVVVVSGALLMGAGDSINEASATSLGPGGFAMLPQQMHHWAKAKGATTIIVYGMGPFDITYVKASDDPRKKTNQ